MGEAVRQGEAEGWAAFELAGETLTLLPEGVLWWARERTLVVADLHLEKGSAFAARGRMLPPYDTAATLARLARLVAALDPALVIALGDSFHDDGGPERMDNADAALLAGLVSARDWVWIAGNHDPALAGGIGGARAETVAIGPLTFRHEPMEQDCAGEVSGHLHPAARVAASAGSVRRRCFVGDGRRLVLPAFGAYAGGLNVLDPAFRPLFPGGAFRAFLLGGSAIYPVGRRSLRPD